MKFINFVARALCCVALMTMATAANAQFVEMGDAGDFPTGTFQGDLTGTAFTQIIGDNTNAGDIDSYLIHVTDASTFFINDVSGTDTKAFLWTPGGAGVLSNDDDPSGANGFSFGFGDANTHTGNIIGAPGTVANGDTLILSVGAFGDTADDAAGNSIFLDDGGDFSALTGVDPAAGGFAGYTAAGAGAYDIQLTGAEIRANVIPEPATTGLLILGLAGVAVRRRK